MKCFRAALIIVFLTYSSLVQATVVNVTDAGTFSDYSDPGGLLPFSMPSAGTEFTLTFSYDDQTSDIVGRRDRVY